jgi:hypothetical protein
MELEAVRGISMSNLRFEVGRQVDDADGRERAFLWADAATNAQAFGDEGNLGFRTDFNTESPRAHYRTRLLAFLSAFLGLALSRVDTISTIL